MSEMVWQSEKVLQRGDHQLSQAREGLPSTQGSQLHMVLRGQACGSNMSHLKKDHQDKIALLKKNLIPQTVAKCS